MLFVKKFKNFILTEATKNINESAYILSRILIDIQKKYQVEGKIWINNLKLKFESNTEYEMFCNDKRFIQSLKQKYNTVDKTIIYNGFVSGYATYEIYIKDLFFNRVVVPKYLYHVTLKHNVDSIKRNGLIPSTNPTYGICSYDKPFIFASINKNKLFINDDDAVVLIINTEGLNNKWYKDFNFPYDNINHICTQQAIPKSAIKIVSYKMFDKNRNKY